MMMSSRTAWASSGRISGRVGQRQTSGFGPMVLTMSGFEDAAGRQAQEDVRAGDRLAQGALVGLLRELALSSSISSVRPS